MWVISAGTFSWSEAKREMAEAGKIQAQARNKQAERLSGKLPPPADGEAQ